MEMIAVIVCFGIIILGIIILVYINIREKKEAIQKIEKLDCEAIKKIQSEGMKYDLDYRYINRDGKIYYHIFLSKENKNVIIQSIKENIVVPFEKIIGAEIVTDGEPTNGIGRSIVGGIIAGGAGAVVGASTAKYYFSSYKIVIYCNDVANPKIEMNLINSEIKRQDSDYNTVVNFSEEVYSIVKSIVANNEKKEEDGTLVESRLSTIKRLLENGEITKEEYDKIRKNILMEI